MGKNLRWPDFIIGGAPKCGTSSLYFWLSAHPEICGSKLKETFFFADEVSRFNQQANIIEKPIEEYCRYFTHCPAHTKAFEATAHYLYYDNARIMLKDLPTKPKMIFIFREPAAQMYSHYRMVRYRIKTYQGTFKDYVDNKDTRFYIEYAKYLKPWLKEWGADRIKVLLFEELMSSKEKTMCDIAEFLEVEPAFFKSFDFEHRNETVAIKSSFLHKLGLRLQPLIGHRLQKLLLPLYLKINSSDLKGKTDEERQSLQSFKPVSERITRELQELLPELDLTHWRKN